MRQFVDFFCFLLQIPMCLLTQFTLVALQESASVDGKCHFKYPSEFSIVAIETSCTVPLLLDTRSAHASALYAETVR